MSGAGTVVEPHDDPDVLARVAWSIVAEPADPLAGAVVEAFGAPAALAWAAWAVAGSPDAAARRLRTMARDADRRAGVEAREDEGGSEAEGGSGDGGAPGPGERPDGVASSVRVLARALPRWAPRFADLEPRRTLDELAAVGGTVLTPGRPGWPERLDDLGRAAPMLLWVRGEQDLQTLLRRSVAVVGARAATAYGQHVAGDLGRGLVPHGVTVVSGGAFGIDAAAHRGALLADGPTIALLAGGVDRPSPAGNLDLLDRMRSDGGALVAESPPGTPPTRSRFLLRNRLIAAVTGATVVVEAAWRSGALSTAARASELLRPLGAVPGPVTSMASVGCHRLLREGGAVCVTDSSDVIELLGPDLAQDEGSAAGSGSAARPESAASAARPGSGRWSEHGRASEGGQGSEAGGRPGPAGVAPSGPTDRADSVESRVLDALHRNRAGSVVEVARRAGLGEREAAAALGLLELAGVVEHAPGGWRRRRRE